MQGSTLDGMPANDWQFSYTLGTIYRQQFVNLCSFELDDEQTQEENEKSPQTELGLRIESISPEVWEHSATHYATLLHTVSLTIHSHTSTDNTLGRILGL